MLYQQFSKPQGFIGMCAGWFMNKENAELNQWTLSFLNLQAHDRVLEIGFGSGHALKMVADYEGVVIHGIDPSETMVRLALKRLNQGSKAAQVCIRQGEAQDLLYVKDRFDKIYAVNNVTFWDEPVQTLTHLRKHLNKGGRLALTLRPHEDGATDDTTEILGGQLRALLEQAGFTNIEIFIKPTRPNNSVCAVAIHQ